MNWLTNFEYHKTTHFYAPFRSTHQFIYLTKYPQRQNECELLLSCSICTEYLYVCAEIVLVSIFKFFVVIICRFILSRSATHRMTVLRSVYCYQRTANRELIANILYTQNDEIGNASVSYCLFIRIDKNRLRRFKGHYQCALTIENIPNHDLQ